MRTTTGAPAPAASRPGERSGEQRWVVPLSDILVDDEIEHAVLGVVRSGWWSMGPQVAELERKYGSFCGAKHAISVANGTAALHLDEADTAASAERTEARSQRGPGGRAWPPAPDR